MFIPATEIQQKAILAAMGDIATCGGQLPLTETDQTALVAANRYLFQSPETLDPDTLSPIPLQTVKTLASDRELAEYTVRFLTVMAFVDGAIDEGKIALVLDYANALDVHETYLQDLIETARHHLTTALADMSRRNLESITGQSWADGDIMAWFLPYRGENARPELANRFQALRELPKGTLGRELYEFYQQQGYAFPGEENGLNERFAIPHDSTHLLSGYDTSPRGEILVSTFTAGMHPNQPMEGHILPIIYSWHLGIKINDVARAATGALDPEEFWHAWARGSEVTLDLFGVDWDFWAVSGELIETLRQRYRVS